MRRKDPLDELPAPFCGEPFVEALADFEAQRKERRHPITPTARKLLYRKLAAMGEARATDALNWSAECNYQGVWEKPAERNGNGYQPSSKASRSQDAVNRVIENG